MVRPIGEGLDIFSLRRHIIEKGKNVCILYFNQASPESEHASYNQALRLVGDLLGGGASQNGKNPKNFALKNEKSLLIF